MMLAMTQPQERAIVFEALLDQAAANSPLDRRWLLLEAAHVVGQTDWRLHFRSHTAMLHLAWRARDFAEAAGQVFRIALVPLGHLLNRLPAGNTGRSSVNAFRPMAVPREVAAVIAEFGAKAGEATAANPPPKA